MWVTTSRPRKSGAALASRITTTTGISTPSSWCWAAKGSCSTPSLPVGVRNHWLTIKLIGTKSNRDGFGARLEAIAGDLHQDIEKSRRYGYLSQSDPRPHFGLGQHTEVDKLTIRWPSGTIKNWTTSRPTRFLTDHRAGKRQTPANSRRKGTMTLPLRLHSRRKLLSAFLCLRCASWQLVLWPPGPARRTVSANAVQLPHAHRGKDSPRDGARCTSFAKTRFRPGRRCADATRYQ